MLFSQGAGAEFIIIKDKKMKKIIVLLVLILSLPATADYAIDWSSIDSGGGMSSGGNYTLVGTIGQPDAGEMSGGDYFLVGGFMPSGLYEQCFVDFEHFAKFAMYWLAAPCDAGNNYCEGSDLDYSTQVDTLDVNELAYWWIAECPLDWPWQ